MRITVKIKDGPQAGKQTELAPSARLRVGRGGASDWAIAEDGYLSNPHFEVVCEEGAWVLRDLDSANGTFLAGRRVTRMPVEGACEIVAGRTTFLLAPEVNVLAMLERSQPLFAILDAARTPRVLELLAGAVERFECLYSGESAVHLAACAPYLVELPRKSRLLRKLVREGWGQSWGVFFVCDRPFEEVRKHFRQFLKVRDESGAEYYFRFYDPRVVRVYLSACDAKERAEFYGPVSAIWADESKALGEQAEAARAC